MKPHYHRLLMQVWQHGRAVCRRQDPPSSGEGLHQRLCHSQWVSSYFTASQSVWMVLCGLGDWLGCLTQVHGCLLETAGPVQGCLQTGSGVGCGVHWWLLQEVQSELFPWCCCWKAAARDRCVVASGLSLLELDPARDAPGDDGVNVRCVADSGKYMLAVIPIRFNTVFLPLSSV